MMKMFVKGDRSAGPLFAKGVRTSDAHMFSKAVPASANPMHPPGGAQNAEHVRNYLERPRR
jgi:hypothetical protein